MIRRSHDHASPDKRRDAVATMFDGVAPRYDLLNDLMSLGQDRLWRKEVVRAVDPKPGDLVLDLAAGTGTSSRPLADAGAIVLAVDVSIGMLEVGHQHHPELQFVNADALSLPFADEVFDSVTMSFGLRNVEDIEAALLEMRRVTKPGGRLVLCEFSTPTWGPFATVYRRYLQVVPPVLGRLTSSNPAAYRYLTESIRTWPNQHVLAGLMHHCGWRQVEWQNLSGGIVAVHRGRR